MGFKNTFELITKDIQEIENLVSNFQNSSNLSAIELDLLLSKLRNVYDLILMIKNHEINNEDKIALEEKTNPKAEELIPVAETDVSIEIDEEKEIIPEPAKAKTIKEEVVVEEVASPKQENISTPSGNQLEKAKILSDKFENNNEFLNEKIGSQSEILSRKIQSGPIDSIASSIGINDKFYFARELFHGKAGDFKQAVEILDKAANFNEAYNYISNHFNWDMNDEPVQNLLNLIRRKFISSNNE